MLYEVGYTASENGVKQNWSLFGVTYSTVKANNINYMSQYLRMAQQSSVGNRKKKSQGSGIFWLYLRLLNNLRRERKKFLETN